jgi:hypothetical protein
MSQSNKVTKFCGSLFLNGHQFETNTAGTLYVDDINVNGGGGGGGDVSYSSIGNLYNTTGAITIFSDTTEITPSGLMITSDQTEIDNYITDPNVIGNSSGSLIRTNSGKSGIYIGDDIISLYNNDNKDIVIEGRTIYFGNSMSSYAQTNITDHHFSTQRISYKKQYCDEYTIETQLTSTSSPVDSHGFQGKINLFTSTLSTMGSVSFTVNNNNILNISTTYPIISIIKYTGNTGHPSVYVSSITVGSYGVTVQNSHNSQSLNGELTLSYNLIAPTPS